MENAKEKSFEYANDLIKLIISLNTGLIGFTVIFLKDFLHTQQIRTAWLLYLSWLVLVLSTFFGIVTVMAIAGSLHDLSKSSSIETEKISIYSKNIRTPSLLTFFLFFIGVVLYIFWAINNL